MPIHRHINHNDMRIRNLALILNHLHQNGPLSRAELTAQLGINKASISTTVRELINRGIVIEIGQKTDNQDVGHPAIDLMINPDAGRIIGVNIEANGVRAIVTDVAPNILWRKEINFQNETELEELFSIIKQIIDEASKVARSYGFPVLGLGLGIPGLVDIENNRLIAAFELNWKDFDLNQFMEGNEDISLHVGNEAHLSAMGESYFGTSKNSETTLYLHWGIEIGGGIIINEDVVPGSLGFAGEVGHFSLNPEGELCACGNRGCWNTYVNLKSISKRVADKTGFGDQLNDQVRQQKISLDKIIQRAKSGDPIIINALNETAKWLGIGISNYINFLNPEYVVIGGPLSVVFNIIEPTLQSEVENRALIWQRNACQIKQSIYHEDACLIGAVATVIWNILNNPRDRNINPILH
ncbi:MAG: ROK family transcriptional regulator [Anaerolineaceae bacterium]|jgi:predicted NBD/HSP70 family sugar kinase/biotin operon repressor|nr:ROK family transcriptional regulator [Anaerolineaceae bacterium]